MANTQEWHDFLSGIADKIDALVIEDAVREEFRQQIGPELMYNSGVQVELRSTANRDIVYVKCRDTSGSTGADSDVADTDLNTVTHCNLK